MKRAIVLAASAFGALVAFACGESLPASIEPSTGASDGGSPTEDATPNDAGSTRVVTYVPSSTGAAPATPVACPLFDCPEAEELCKDEACEPGNLDFAIDGTVRVTSDNKCVAEADANAAASMARTQTPEETRQHVTLSLRVEALATTGRTIATVGANLDQGGERLELFARRTAAGAAIELCEHAASGTRCTAAVDVPIPTTLHLFGTATTVDPPNARFALATDASTCAPLSLIDVTRPFAAGDLRAAVGCLEDQQPRAACAMTFDDAVFLLRPE